MIYRRLSKADRFTLHKFRKDAEAWLAAKGLDQYQSNPRALETIDSALAQGQFVGLEAEGELVAAGAWVEANPMFWTPEERQQSAWYVGRLMVSGQHHGQGYGETLLNRFMVGEARQSGASYVRLDCWRSNSALHEYYQRLGFEHIRTVAGRSKSGALFQIAL